MNEEEARQSYFELKVLEEQMNQVKQQISNIENQISELEEASKNIDELKEKGGSETFVPVTMGVYSKAKLEDTKSFIVNVGAGIAVEKSADETKKLIEQQVSEMKNYHEQMSRGLQLMGARAEEIENKVMKEENVQIS